MKGRWRGRLSPPVDYLTQRARDDAPRFVEALRRGDPAADALFDGLVPRRWHGLSGVHWTPVEVARAAASMLALKPGERLLDVGSGLGKLCIVGSLLSDGEWVGVEQRPHLVQAARELASGCGAASTRFFCQDAFSVDWRRFDALYFFNPFAPLDLSDGEPFDATYAADSARAERSATLTREWLGRLPEGRRVLVCFDLGAELPASFELARAEEVGEFSLSLFVQTRR